MTSSGGTVDLAAQIARVGALLIDAPADTLPDELVKRLNDMVGRPFKAAIGTAFDRDGRMSAPASVMIFAGEPGPSKVEGEGINVEADQLACLVDVTHTLDLEKLRAAYARIAHAKTLNKAPAAAGVMRTTITFGVIFAVVSAVPLEALAAELDRLNQQTGDHNWPDMVVVASHGLISYAAQIPGDAKLSGQWMPPAEGALCKFVPATYVVMVIKPSDGGSTFNQMMHTVLAHLWLFCPGADLLDREEVVKGVENLGFVQVGYQYNLAGELKLVPPEQIQGRMMPLRPYFVEDRRGKPLAALKFFPWQDGGVIVASGQLPLDGMLVFFANSQILRRAGTIRHGEFQVSHVLPITERDFHEMLQRFQQRSNMIVRRAPGKWVVRKYADEGSSSPFMARLFLGMLTLSEAMPTTEREALDTVYEPLITTLMEIRGTAKELTDLYTGHAGKIADGSIVQMQGASIHISESIDRQLRKLIDEFLTTATRSFKDRMQRVTSALGVNIGFLYQKQGAFEAGLAAMMQADRPLAEYIHEARQWGQVLVDARNDMEHNGWRLPAPEYAEAGGVVSVAEPLISGQPVTAFAIQMTDRLMCFVEDVTAHCIGRYFPAAMAITEIPLEQRPATVPSRFQPTLAQGGLPLWQIAYHATAFDIT